MKRDPAVDLVRSEARLRFGNRRHPSRDEFNRLTERVTALEASQQQNQVSIDAATAAVQAIGPKLDTVKTEIDALKAQVQATGQQLNFSGLDNAVAALSTQADADVADAAPATPTPPAGS